MRGFLGASTRLASAPACTLVTSQPTQPQLLVVATSTDQVSWGAQLAAGGDGCDGLREEPPHPHPLSPPVQLQSCRIMMRMRKKYCDE